LKYFFSGVDSRYSQVFYPPLANAGVMFNATTLHLPEVQLMCAQYCRAGIPMVLDCGMIQGKVKEDDYIELLCRFGDYFDWFASIDVHGSLGLSNGGYNYLRDYLPEGLHRKLLYVLHGSPEEGFTEAQFRTLDLVLTYATPYIGIGGLAPYCRRGKFAVIERYLDMIYAVMGREVCQNTHLLGVGNYRLLHRYRHTFGSADSSSFLCAVRGEQLQPRGGRLKCQRPFNKLHVLRTNVETMLDWAGEDAYQLPLFADLPPVGQPRVCPTGGVSPYLLPTM
jgi:hypothetical protein